MEVRAIHDIIKDIILPWGFLIRDMEDRFIPDVMNDVFFPKEETLKICIDIFITSV